MQENNPNTLIALLSGPNQKGIVAKVSAWIFENNGNIIHADQHYDQSEGIFFQRVEWIYEEGNNIASVASEFTKFSNSIGMKAKVAIKGEKPKIALLVSKFDHCFHDLILRWKAGEFPCSIELIISNHADLRSAATNYEIPFYHIPINKSNKPEAEAEQLAILKQNGVELVILARYMQILSPIFLDTLNKPVINIHHSFLPAFVGAKPYHQAFKKGVKIIGATAHYVTADLDQGPIINQGVTNVTHRHSVSSFIQKGRDLEKMTLSQAVRWHLESRILVYENKTVVFE